MIFRPRFNLIDCAAMVGVMFCLVKGAWLAILPIALVGALVSTWGENRLS